MATGFGIALHDAGLPVGPDRCERLARAVTVMGATTVAELRACALATMVSDPGQMPTFDRVFAAVFGGPSPFRHLNLPTAPRSYERPESDGSPQPQGRSEDKPGDLPSGLRVSDAVPAAAESDEPLVEGPAVHRVASATERLSGRDFTELSPAELRDLVALMREMTLAIPPRRTRRYRPARDGKRPDLRGPCARPGAPAARRSGCPGARRGSGRAAWSCCATSRARWRPTPARCSCSCTPCTAARSAARRSQNRPEVFSFATRLTRLTPALAAASPDTMLAKAGEAAPDWSGGTRIGAALKEFNDQYGSRGMARGAVVLIISDGWETGDAALLGEQMARLSRMAYRIVWANPAPSRPVTARRSAAWPRPGPTATPWSARTASTRSTTWSSALAAR